MQNESSDIDNYDNNKSSSNKSILKRPIFWIILAMIIVIIIVIIVVVIVVTTKSDDDNNINDPNENINNHYLCLDSNGIPSKNCLGGWFYESDKYGPEYNVKWLVQHKWNYVFITGDVSNDAGKQRIIEHSKLLKENHISYHVMTLEDNSKFINDPNLAIQRVSDLIDFITTENIEVAGIHIDVEPHGMTEWQEGNDETKNEIFQKYLYLLEEVRKVMNKRKDLLFSAAVAWWYSSNTDEGILTNGKGNDLANEKRLHMLVPMIYDVGTDNTDRVISRAHDYMLEGADVLVGIQYSDHTNIENACNVISTSLANDESVNIHFYGISIFSNHYYNDWGENL